MGSTCALITRDDLYMWFRSTGLFNYFVELTARQNLYELV